MFMARSLGIGVASSDMESCGGFIQNWLLPSEIGMHILRRGIRRRVFLLVCILCIKCFKWVRIARWCDVHLYVCYLTMHFACYYNEQFEGRHHDVLGEYFNIRIKTVPSKHNSLFIVIQVTCFDLIRWSSSGLFRTCRQVLCTYWDPSYVLHLA
jgi:hypothetical protein